MRRISIFLTVLLVFPLLADDRKVLDEVVARVNNQIITLSEYRQADAALRQELSQRSSGSELEEKFAEESKDSLRNLIDMALLVQYGTEQGYSVEADVLRQIDRIRQENGFQTMEELERAMLAQGVNIEDVKQQYRDQMMYQMVIQRDVSRSVFLTDEEVEAYYEEHKEELSQPESVRLREILISTANRTEEQAADRTREVLARIRKGDDFGELAREYSDATTAQEGGELGAFDPKTLSEKVQELVAKLREGGVADPQLTPEGYMVLQLVERTEGGIPPLEKARNAVSNELYMDRVQPAFRKFLDRMRKENYVYVKIGYTDSGAIPVEPKPVLRGRRRRKARSTQ